MRRLAAIGIMVLAITGSVSAGSIYKCVDAAGNVSFSQTACPAAASGGEIGYSAPSQQPSSNQAGEQRRSLQQKRRPANPVVQFQPQASTPHYQISPMEQLEQIERDKEKRAVKRKQWQLDQEKRLDKLRKQRIEEEELKVKRDRAKDPAKEQEINRAMCAYHRAQARLYMRIDEVNYTYNNMKAAEYCD